MKRFVSMVFIGLVMVLGMSLAGCGDDDGGGGESGSTAVTGVSLNKSSTTITVGSTEQLTSTVEPANATDKRVNWSSDNESVATVATDGHGNRGRGGIGNDNRNHHRRRISGHL